ncbi:type II toxin-antitoxin system death-on-curing family toxin [Flagellimonas hymeniacidonis]|uniref:Type II toxin-antitoxin system death-on-curing family toxin n=1 Tax=Flagellimonas hymeniacidonis TaxID=2603628 RepID=A0A5C8V0B8_9FLAO|nr:RhuM family protein [Flagellimonas hymeniacidonis]TXN34756.1 type II toxin-antitoxin system death-on-curing family toxin [Flagellimonas hymeniacidonis]
MSYNIEIYKTEDGKSEIQVNLEKDTVWLSINQLAKLFERDKSVISRHIKNIFSEKELLFNSTVAKNATVPQNEGGRVVERKIDLYNLDVIISVGYRVKSNRGTQFRQWANQKLKDYLIKGYAINQRRLAEKEEEIHFLRSSIRIVTRAIEEKAGKKGYEYLNLFSKGLLLLDDYDHENLDSKGLTKRTPIYPKESEYQDLVNKMKTEFNSDIFGFEKDESFKSALAQISKGFGETDFYPSLEEKAATLLYLIVKNHAFTDGNKRIAAACFLMFLESNKLLFNEEGEIIISNEALASLTLFIASSNAEEMETVKRLVISILNRNKNNTI